MSLQLQAVDRLFDRLSATYGAAFLRGYEGVDPSAVKTVWAHELSGFAGNLQALAWALENLPERAPNAIEFRNLARKAPQPEAPRLPEPKADPARVRAELAKMGQMRSEVTRKSIDASWAHRIVRKAESGVPVASAVLRIARDVATRHPA